MKINDESKLQILLVQIQERYSALHNIRERSTTFVVWIVGMALGLAWLLIKSETINLFQLILLIVLFIGLSVLVRNFLTSLESGFNNQRQILAKIERLLGLFDKNVYGQEEVLPASFENIEKKPADHFQTLYYIIVGTFIILLGLAISNYFSHNQTKVCPDLQKTSITNT